MKKTLSAILACAAILVGSRAIADTTTSRFGMTKPDIGSTNWGPKLNTNFDTIDNAAGLSLSNNYSGQATFASSATFNSEIRIGGSTMTFSAAISSGTRTDISTITAQGLVINGRKTDNSTTTFTGGDTFSGANTFSGNDTLSGTKTNNSTSTYTGGNHFRNGIDASSSPSTSQVFGVWGSSITTSLPTYIAGTTTNDNAPAGAYGEYISSFPTSRNYAATTHYTDAASVTLTAGDWEIRALSNISAVASVTEAEFFIGAVAGDNSTGLTIGTNFYRLPLPDTNSGREGTLIYRVTPTSSTTYYLKIEATFSGSTPTCTPNLQARRMR